MVITASMLQIYYEKEQVEQGKIQNVQFEEIKGSRKFNGAKSCVVFKETNKLKTCLMLNEIKGVVTS